MSFEQRKLIILALWVASVFTVGIILTVDTPSLWIFVASLAIAPAALGSWLWHAPEVSMAQIIERHRR
jgi:hypothetical protein